MKHGVKCILSVLILGVVFVHCKKSTSEDKKIWTDDFNRGDGHPGSNYTLYLPSGTTLGIVSQQLYPTFSGAAPAAFYNSNITVGHTTSAKFTLTGVPTGTPYTGYGYIVGRSSSLESANNAYVCGYNAGSLVLGRIASGTTTVIASALLHSLVSGVSDTITMTFDSSTIKCAITGGSTLSISVVDGTYGNGYDGVMGGGSSQNYLRIDDLSIQKL